MKCDALLVVGSKTSHIAAAEHMHTCMDKTRSSILKGSMMQHNTPFRYRVVQLDFTPGIEVLYMMF